MNGLVVIPCGKKKAAHAAPAGELYQGSYFTAILTYAKTLSPDDRIVILSGKHGLLRLTDVIEPYEQRIDQPGAVTVKRVELQARVMGLTIARPVIALTGSAYSKIVTRVWPHAHFPLRTVRGGMGKQLQWLKKQVGQ